MRVFGFALTVVGQHFTVADTTVSAFLHHPGQLATERLRMGRHGFLLSQG